MHKTGLYWFTNDLRLVDNPAFSKACRECRQLLCIYIVDPVWFAPNLFTSRVMGKYRWRFLHESLGALKQALRDKAQELFIVFRSPEDVISQLITIYDIDAIYRSQNAGFNEIQSWETLKSRYSSIVFTQIATHTLFSEASLSFSIRQHSNSLLKFYNQVLTLKPEIPIAEPESLPPAPSGSRLSVSPLPSVDLSSVTPYAGGADHAQSRLEKYFQDVLSADFNELPQSHEGLNERLPLSAWLANGSLSVRQLNDLLDTSHAPSLNQQKVDETRFKLLSREYFHWYTHRYGARVFAHTGVKRKKLLTCFYGERQKRWCAGNTPYPLVNALMHQLNATGYISHQGRRIVASCFINELEQDWRYGAAYFEQQLIDYDVAINWGSWQYLAGVSADPRDKIHLDLKCLTEELDPGRKFINRWQGDAHDKQLDTIDASDWPIL